MRRSFAVYIIRLLVVLVTITILTACNPMPAYTGTPGRPRVAVVGDSITYYATSDTNEALIDFRHTVRGIPKIGLTSGRTELVDPAVATRPDILVIELGLNSAMDGWDGSDLPSLDAVLTAADPVPCVVWVAPDALTPSWYDHKGRGTLHDRQSAFVASLSKRLPAHPHQHLSNWGPIERTYPTYYLSDHLHITPSGRLAYAALVDASIKEFCPYG